jgi:hypothetical protein
MMVEREMELNIYKKYTSYADNTLKQRAELLRKLA